MTLDQSALTSSSGLMSVTGTADGQRVRCGYSVADVSTGMFALIGILMALRSRDASGLGQFVDISMLDSMISAMTPAMRKRTAMDLILQARW